MPGIPPKAAANTRLSVLLALVVFEEEPELPALGAILATVTVAVMASVVLHGITAPPLCGPTRAGSSA